MYVYLSICISLSMYIYTNVSNLTYCFGLCWVFIAAWAFLQLQGAGTTLQFGAQASHCSGLTCCRAQVCRLQQLPHMSSVVASSRF